MREQFFVLGLVVLSSCSDDAGTPAADSAQVDWHRSETSESQIINHDQRLLEDSRAHDQPASADGTPLADTLTLDAPWFSDSATTQDKVKLNLTFSGCQPDFGGKLYVAQGGGALHISSINTLGQAMMQLDLKVQSGTIAISSEHRQQTGTLINLVTQGTTYTNLTFDPQYWSGQAPDPISGTVIIGTYQPIQGIAQLTFQNVTLENVLSPHDHCTMNGTLETMGLSF